MSKRGSNAWRSTRSRAKRSLARRRPTAISTDRRVQACQQATELATIAAPADPSRACSQSWHHRRRRHGGAPLPAAAAERSDGLGDHRQQRRAAEEILLAHSVRHRTLSALGSPRCNLKQVARQTEYGSAGASCHPTSTVPVVLHEDRRRAELLRVVHPAELDYVEQCATRRCANGKPARIARVRRRRAPHRIAAKTRAAPSTRTTMSNASETGLVRAVHRVTPVIVAVPGAAQCFRASVRLLERHAEHLRAPRRSPSPALWSPFSSRRKCRRGKTSWHGSRAIESGRRAAHAALPRALSARPRAHRRGGAALGERTNPSHCRRRSVPHFRSDALRPANALQAGDAPAAPPALRGSASDRTTTRARRGPARRCSTVMDGPFTSSILMMVGTLSHLA